jgi:UDP-N-acetylmuramate dehydrogenase
MSEIRLADYTTLHVGGPAREFRAVTDEQALVEAVRDADAAGVPVLLLGGGSNLLISDDGFDGLVIKIATTGIDAGIVCGAGRVEAAAGEDWDGFVTTLIDEGYAGAEALSGIPGCVGATPIQNVGAYGQEISQILDRVRVLDRTDGTVRDLTVDECGFGYRDSRFKRDPHRFVVLSAVFEMPRSRFSRPIRYGELSRAVNVGVGDRAESGQVREAVLALRRSKGMVIDPADHDTWSAGSFFTNPVVPAESLPPDAPAFPVDETHVKASAAWLIEYSGFHKGYGQGPARISTKHSLALTNRGGATAADVVALARTIRDGVRERTGIALVPEPVLLGCSLDG